MCSTGVLRQLLVLSVDVMDSGDDNREVAPGLGSMVDDKVRDTKMMMNTVCRIYLLLFIVRNLKYVQVE